MPVRVPTAPDAPGPLIVSPRSRTERCGSFTPTGMLTMTPVVPDDRIDPIVAVQSMVMDLVIVTVPYPPGSRQLISPLMKVLDSAPEKVRHGAVRLHGLASLPTPETKVRVACALAGAAESINAMAVPLIRAVEVLMFRSLVGE